MIRAPKPASFDSMLQLVWTEINPDLSEELTEDPKNKRHTQHGAVPLSIYFNYHQHIDMADQESQSLYQASKKASAIL